jgi:peptidoglycan/LPS O-acetylase OafA/YrhL
MPTKRRAYLDGMRALAALYVLLFHVYIWYFRPVLPASTHWFLNWLSYGSVAVAIFICISGYCLGLSQRPAGEFLIRRCRRILPPYVAAVALTMLISPWSAGQLTAHAFLMQNMADHWRFTGNYALWSIATEFQFYLLCPLILATFRFGRVSGLGFVALLTAIAIAISYRFGGYPGACLWLLLPFGIGLLMSRFNIPKFPWGILGIAAAVILAGICAISPARENFVSWPIEAARQLAGAAVALCIIGAAETSPTNQVRQILEYRPLVVLGGFSYSLYLIHSALLYRIHPQNLGIALLSIPIVIAVAAVFYRLFERPFLNPPTLPKAAPVPDSEPIEQPVS